MSYERSMDQLSRMLYFNDVENAADWVSHKKVMKKGRNEVLLHMELGAIERISGRLEESQYFLQRADLLIEDRNVGAGQRAMSLMSNPRSLPYKTEFFERIAVHYMKCLNFLKMGQVNSARVEARRANLALQSLNDAVPDKPLKYHDDVLAHVIMGLAYEANNEINNAFIAYRNAVNLFLTEDGKLKKYMGTTLPRQISCDLLRTARLMNFGSDYSYYKRILGVNCEHEVHPASNGELIVFWENGLAPEKEEVIVNLGLSPQGNGGLQVYNSAQNIESTISAREMQQYNINLSNDNIAIALPIYRPRASRLSSGRVLVNGHVQDLELLENLNVIAPQSLKDRYARELANAVVRVLAKRAIQEALSSIEIDGDDEKEDDKEEGKSNDNENNEKSKEDNNNQTQVDLGQIYNIFSTLSERADIRGWHSLPAEISFARIPLRQVNNQIQIELYDHGKRKLVNQKINIQSTGGMQFMSIITPGNEIINKMTNHIDNKNNRS
jgi:hypothetical protein